MTYKNINYYRQKIGVKFGTVKNGINVFEKALRVKNLCMYAFNAQNYFADETYHLITDNLEMKN